MPRVPFFKLYIDDFVGGVADMTTEEVGAYVLLLCYQWGKGYIPDDGAKIRRIGHLTADADIGLLTEKFPLSGHGRQNLRMEQERKKMEAFSKRGKRNVDERWKYQNDTKGIPNAYQNDTPIAIDHSHSHSSIDQKPKKIKSTSNGFDGFTSFWSAYPKKVEKQKVIKWFKAHHPKQEVVLAMIEAITAQRNTDQWKRGFIKNPLTWLTGGCWEDEPFTVEDPHAEDVMDRWMKAHQEDAHDEAGI
jgi:uncharacterized protein YdaU (DUF1376 family)